MANIRRKNGLGKNPERAETRAAQLTAIDPDWACPWPLDWQRHYRVLAQLAEDEPGGRLPEIPPGELFDGDDLGRWPESQANNWRGLSDEQQRRLTALGVTPAERPRPEATSGGKGAGKLSAAFQPGVAALAQYITREGHYHVPRSHVEEIAVDGHDTAVDVRLGVFTSNTKSRRDKLTEPQRTTLAELGVEWA
ncbi:helicase associated domain-containing protein [Streptomyces asiaticus]